MVGISIHMNYIDYKITNQTRTTYLFLIGADVINTLVGSILADVGIGEESKSVVAVVVAPAFTAGARRAARDAAIPVILTNEAQVVEAVFRYSRQSNRSYSIVSAIGIAVGFLGTIAIQNL